ncbi:hypothetical protein E2C01_102235 [Portunus trituberculatus]|uniref:Uncharacterized protein n=1 Tax=Portunus trituberculatus TaxID=210409 RepID=A0A5B7KC07_PORTR|nr:hypothetical protein [Portunus trituberculatus]
MASTGASGCGGTEVTGGASGRLVRLFHIYLELLIFKRFDEVVACEHRDQALWCPGISAPHQRLQVLCQPREWLPLAPGPLLKLSPIHLSRAGRETITGFESVES